MRLPAIIHPIRDAEQYIYPKEVLNLRIGEAIKKTLRFKFLTGYTNNADHLCVSSGAVKMSFSTGHELDNSFAECK